MSLRFRRSGGDLRLTPTGPESCRCSSTCLAVEAVTCAVWAAREASSCLRRPERGDVFALTRRPDPPARLLFSEESAFRLEFEPINLDRV